MLLKLLLVSLLMGGQEAPPSPVSSEIIPLVVRTLSEYGKTMAAAKSAGPLHVDTASLRSAARQLGEPYEKGKIASAAGRDIKESRKSDAIVCNDAGPKGTRQCFVAASGTLIAIDSVRTTTAGVEVHATLTWTDQRKSGALSTGAQSWLLTFGHTSTGWRLTSSRLERQT